MGVFLPAVSWLVPTPAVVSVLHCLILGNHLLIVSFMVLFGVGKCVLECERFIQ